MKTPTRGPVHCFCRKGRRLRLNLDRHDRADAAGIAFSPTLVPTFHNPDRFGWLGVVDDDTAR